MSGHDVCAMLMTEEVPSMVRELPEEALRELAEEITALQASALQLGEPKGLREIYSPHE